MPTFREYFYGEMDNGTEIQSRENPFYHARRKGETTWTNGGSTLK